MTSDSGIMDMISGMDSWSLKQLVVSLSESIGGDRCVQMVRKAVGSDIRTDRETVVSKVQDALVGMDGIFLSGPYPDVCNECRSPKDLAFMLSLEAVRDTCLSDVSTLVRVGRRNDAERYVRGIVEALSTVRCAMTEHAPSCCSELSDWFLDCMARGDVLGGFE